MPEDYEYYGKYDEDAKGEINLEEQIRDWLWVTELIFRFVKSSKPEMHDIFLKNVETKYANDLGKALVLSDGGFERVLKDHSLLDAYPQIKELGLLIIIKYLQLEEGYILIEETESIRYIDYLRAKHMLLYYQITALVEILGRESGIEFFMSFVQFWGMENAKKDVRTVAIRDARVSFVKFWKESNAFEFGVVDIDDNAFLAKFDRCVWYESMKHVGDQELAYYAVCYPGPRLGRLAHQSISMRRSVTLFTGDFCDELRWDRHVHDEPEQPSHEFSRRIVPK